MSKRLIVFTISLIVLIFFMMRLPESPTKATLYASNFAIYDALRSLIPEEENIELFIPLGQDLHTFSPNPKMVADALASKNFFYVKGAMNGWLKKLLEHNSVANFVDLSSNIVWEESEEEDHNHAHHDDEHDPHYWLSIENQIKVTKNIYEVLIKNYPETKSFLTKNLDNYISKLVNLKKESQEKVAHCKLNKIIVTHNAFSYLAKEFGFDVISMVGISPQSMANPSKMQSVIEKIKDSGYQTIFFESFISDKIAKTIAQESGARVDVLHTIATLTQEEHRAKKGYVDLMAENIEKISKAMQCR